MKPIALVIFVALLLPLSVLGQPLTGQVQGTVQLPTGLPAVGADVWLSGVGDGIGHPHHPHFRAMTGPAGLFGFPWVPPGVYTVAAAQPMGGHASSLIEVLARQTTNVSLTLHRCDSVFTPDSMTSVELVGTAIVVQSQPPRQRTFYFLDVNNDTVPDYRLAFGPPWYEPPSGAVRPQNGDEIMIVGGFLTYGDPPMVIVFQINGLPWRDPRAGGHGGHGGNAPYSYMECGGHTASSNAVAQASPLLFEARGMVLIPTCLPPPVNPPGVFLFHPEMSDHNVYVNLGTDWEGIPGGFEPVDLVGGLVPGTPGMEPWVIVYEVNGEFVREPGDTTDLVPLGSAVEDELPTVPVSHLTATNYPNPFNPATTIEYSIPVAGSVALRVFDITGREMSTLVNGYHRAGTYRVAWDGSAASSGIYLYRVSAGGMSYAGRMVLLK